MAAPSAIGARIRAKLSPLGNVHTRASGPLDRVVARLRRPLDRFYLRRYGRLGDLKQLGESCGRAEGGAPRILVLALRAFPNHTAYEVVIAQALRRRAAEVALLTCGGGQPVCEMGWSRRVWPRPCDRCASFTDALIEVSGIRSFRLADGLPWGDDGRRAPLEPPDPDGLPVDPAEASAISVPWFLHASDVDSLPEGPAAAGDYAVAAAGVAESARQVFDEFQPDIVFMVNGLFASERMVRGVAAERDARVVTYEMTPRANALFFSQETPAAHYDVDELWESVRDRELDDDQRAAIEKLLAERASGVGAYERYFDSQEEDPQALRRLLEIPNGSRVASLFTNLTWDSATVGRDLGFSSMVDWMTDAVRVAAESPELTLVVRIHPGEAKWQSREDVQAKVVSRFAELPPNVRFIGPRDPLSSYALLELSDRVLTYTSTTGLEAANRRLPVAVGGDVHYRGRGFTWDLEAPADLAAFLREPGLSMSAEQVALAQRYAFTFFFRASIPFPVVPVVGGKPLPLPTSCSRLDPGVDPYLDLVCDRIIDGRDFHTPDELALVSPLEQPGWPAS